MSERGTRRCRSCRRRLPLSAFDLRALTYRCRNCGRIWVACVPALVRLRNHYGDPEELARVLDLAPSTVRALLYSPRQRMTAPLSRRVRDAYAAVAGTSGHVRATVEELEASSRAWASVWRSG